MISVPKRVMRRSASRVSAIARSPSRGGCSLAQKSRAGRGALVAANAVGLFFGTTTGHTEEAADMIKEAWSGDITDPTDISEVDISSLPDYDGLVVGGENNPAHENDYYYNYFIRIDSTVEKLRL